MIARLVSVGDRFLHQHPLEILVPILLLDPAGCWAKEHLRITHSLVFSCYRNLLTIAFRYCIGNGYI